MRSSAEPAAAWVGLAALLGAGACLASLTDTRTLDWQPALVWREPWRAWSAAFVHWSALHLAANLAGAAAVAALGWMARVPSRTVVAWIAAWPLTHVALLLRPDLLRYGGLSGVLHAGVAAVALFLVARCTGRRRLIGMAVLIGLVGKVLIEAPWAAALRYPAGWDIAVAPFAHAAGVAAGLATATAAELLPRRRAVVADRRT